MDNGEQNLSWNVYQHSFTTIQNSKSLTKTSQILGGREKGDKRKFWRRKVKNVISKRKPHKKKKERKRKTNQTNNNNKTKQRNHACEKAVTNACVVSVNSALHKQVARCSTFSETYF